MVPRRLVAENTFRLVDCLLFMFLGRRDARLHLRELGLVFALKRRQRRLDRRRAVLPQTLHSLRRGGVQALLLRLTRLSLRFLGRLDLCHRSRGLRLVLRLLGCLGLCNRNGLSQLSSLRHPLADHPCVCERQLRCGDRQQRLRLHLLPRRHLRFPRRHLRFHSRRGLWLWRGLRSRRLSGGRSRHSSRPLRLCLARRLLLPLFPRTAATTAPTASRRVYGCPDRRHACGSGRQQCPWSDPLRVLRGANRRRLRRSVHRGGTRLCFGRLGWRGSLRGGRVGHHRRRLLLLLRGGVHLGRTLLCLGRLGCLRRGRLGERPPLPAFCRTRRATRRRLGRRRRRSTGGARQGGRAAQHLCFAPTLKRAPVALHSRSPRCRASSRGATPRPSPEGICSG
mmetsp:Transcript_869/g.2494  ORF Transcript_869/g.2494 Transcript_869/m.2494 type:complete len:395 (-) Transcript_869:40-1224(-)